MGKKGARKFFYGLSLTLLIIGGLTWGLIGAFGFNPISSVFGTASSGSLATQIIYGVVGLSAVGIIVCKMTEKKK